MSEPAALSRTELRRARESTLCPLACTKPRPHLLIAGSVGLYVCCACYMLEMGECCDCAGGMKLMSELSDAMAFQLTALGLTDFEREYRFHPVRKWRADLAFVREKLLIECDGATWTNGAHSRGSGKQRDCEKDCEAVLLGYRVMRFTTNMIADGSALAYVQRALRANSEKGRL